MGQERQRDLKPWYQVVQFGAIRGGTCAVDQLVIMPLSLVCKPIGNMQASWAACHLTFSRAGHATSSCTAYASQ